QREHDRVRAGAQIHDGVAALAVGSDGPCFFDEHVAAGFDSDAGHHRAARIADHTVDRALSTDGARGQQQEQDDEPGNERPTSRDTVHWRLLLGTSETYKGRPDGTRCESRDRARKRLKLAPG